MPSLGGAARGAGTGAALGSFLPGIGTGIGAGIGGIIGLFGGGGHGDDHEDDKPSVDNTVAALRDRSKKTSGQADDLGAEADNLLGPVAKYLKQLTSGNPSELMAATAPERARVVDQYDTASRALATFGPRGGGSNSAIAQAGFAKAQALGDITTNARRSAMDKSAQLGLSEAGLSLSADQLASADLSAILSSLTSQRGQTLEMWSGIGQAAGSILGQYLGRDNS